MLKTLRKKGVAKKVIWFVAIVIIISFGFFGTAYLLSGSSSTSAGRIFGKKISFEDFNKIYQHTRTHAIMRHGDNFNNIRNLLNLEAETWDRLILIYDAKKRKIKITDAEVVTAIESYPFFQRDNRFDSLLYNDVLRFVFRMKPRDFEESIRDSLKFAKLMDLETSNIKISEQEIREQYINLNERVQVSFVFVTPEKFLNEVTFVDEAGQSYYAEHRLEFLAPPSINVEYILFPFPESKIEASPEEIENIEHEKDQLWEQADVLFQSLGENPNLEETSTQNKVQYKTTGFFSQEQPNLSFGLSFDDLNALFQPDNDDIQPPLETPKGILITKVKERRDSYIPKYEEAKEEVKNVVVLREAMIIAREKTKIALASLNESLSRTHDKDFPEAAKALELELYQTPIFKRGDYLPKVGLSQEFQESAFALKNVGNISPVVETSNAFCILHLDSKHPPEIDQFEVEKEPLREMLLSERRNRAFNDYITRVRIEAKLEDNISKTRNQTQ